MSVAIYLPLLFALGLLAVVSLSSVSDRIDRVVTSLSLKLFHGAVKEHGQSKQKRKRLLHAVHSVTTYPAYATKTISFATTAGVAASIIGTYLAYAGLAMLVTYRETVKAVLPDQIHFVVAESPSGGPAGGPTGADSRSPWASWT